MGLVAPQTLELLRSNAVRGDHARVILILFRVIPRLRGAFLKPKAFYMGIYIVFSLVSSKHLTRSQRPIQTSFWICIFFVQMKLENELIRDYVFTT